MFSAAPPLMPPAGALPKRGSTMLWPPPPLPPVSDELQVRLEALEVQTRHQTQADVFLERRVEQLQEELRSAEEASGRCAVLQQQIEHLERRELSWSQHAGSLEAARDADRREAEGWRRELADEAERMRADLERLLQLHASERGLREGAQQKHRDLAGSFEQLQAEFRQLQESHAAECSSSEEARQRHMQVNAGYERLQADFAQLQDRQVQHDRDRLTHEHSTRMHKEAVAECERLQENVLKLQVELQAVTASAAEKRQLQKEVQQLRNELHEHRSTHVAEHGKLHDRLAEMQLLREEAENTHRLEVEHLRDQASQNHSAFQAEKQLMQDELLRVSRELEEHKRSLDTSDQELAKIRDDSESTHRSKLELQAELEEHLRAREELQAQLEQQRRLREDLHAEVSQHKRAREEAERLHMQARAELDKLQEAQKKTAAESQKMLGQLQQAAGDVAEQRRRNASIEAGYSQAAQEADQLREQIAAMSGSHQRSLDEVHMKHRDLEEQLLSERRQATETAQRHDAAHEQVQQLTLKLKAMQAQLDELERLKRDHDREVGIRKDLAHRLQAALAEIAQLEQRNASDRRSFEARERLNSVMVARSVRASLRDNSSLHDEVGLLTDRVRGSLTSDSSTRGEDSRRGSAIPVDLLSLQDETESPIMDLPDGIGQGAKERDSREAQAPVPAQRQQPPPAPRLSARAPAVSETAVAPGGFVSDSGRERRLPVDLSALDSVK